MPHLGEWHSLFLPAPLNDLVAHFRVDDRPRTRVNALLVGGCVDQLPQAPVNALLAPLLLNCR